MQTKIWKELKALEIRLQDIINTSKNTHEIIQDIVSQVRKTSHIINTIVKENTQNV